MVQYPDRVRNVLFDPNGVLNTRLETVSYPPKNGPLPQPETTKAKSFFLKFSTSN